MYVDSNLFAIRKILGPEDERCMILRNVRKYVPLKTAQRLRRLECSKRVTVVAPRQMILSSTLSVSLTNYSCSAEFCKDMFRLSF